MFVLHDTWNLLKFDPLTAFLFFPHFQGFSYLAKYIYMQLVWTTNVCLIKTFLWIFSSNFIFTNVIEFFLVCNIVQSSALLIILGIAEVNFNLRFCRMFTTASFDNSETGKVKQLIWIQTIAKSLNLLIIDHLD